MKNSIRYTFALLAIGAVLPVAGLFAQSPAPASTPSVSVPPADTSTTTTTDTTTAAGKHGGGKMRERLAVLTPEERQQFLAAHKKAMQDPAVKAAEATRTTDKKGFRKTVADAMLRADPSIGPVLEKLKENRPGKKKNA